MPALREGKGERSSEQVRRALELHGTHLTGKPAVKPHYSFPPSNLCQVGACEYEWLQQDNTIQQFSMSCLH